MRKFLLGAAISLLVGGVAYADSFVVVRSTDPSIVKGATYSSGDRIVPAKGKTVTLINGSGTVTPITHRPGGVVLPGANSADASPLFARIRAMSERPPARRTFGAMRGRDDAESCPKPADLTTIELILAAEDEGCSSVADEAMTKFIANASKPE